MKYICVADTAQKMNFFVKNFFSKCEQIRICSHLLKKFLTEKFIFFGLCYFMIRDPTIHDPTMQDSCINYSNMLKLCRENYATGKINFAAQSTKSFAPCEQTFLRNITWSLPVFS